jgi:molybdopterin converting factor small subunit
MAVGIHTATVRFFGAARSAAKIEEERLGITAGTSVSALAAELVRRHGAELSRVLTRCSYLVDGVAVRDLNLALSNHVTVDVLPPFAGG